MTTKKKTLIAPLSDTIEILVYIGRIDYVYKKNKSHAKKIFSDNRHSK
jgi:hypothetical protein